MISRDYFSISIQSDAISLLLPSVVNPSNIWFRLRTQFNDKANGAYKLSVNDFVVKAAAIACTRVPEANSSWSDDFVRR